MNSTLARLLRRFTGWIFVVAILCPLWAQNEAPLSPNRVTFFTEPNFKGDALTVEAGASVDNLDTLRRPDQRPWTFAISSVQIEGAAKATVYSSAGLAGDRLDISRNITDLYAERRGSDGSWDHAIASLAVTGLQPPAPVYSAPAHSQPQSAASQQPPTPMVVQPQGPIVVQQPPPVVIRQEQPRTVIVVPPPPPQRPPVVIREVRPRLDRRTAEMMVQQAYREVLNRPADAEGLHTYRDRLMYEGWTQRQIVEQLQRSGEARGVNADAAISAAYQEVLGREPDPAGLAHYRAKWRDGWTQGQIRDDLRRSKEGRDGNIRTAITRAFREVLGREPDPAGYATYEKLMRERGYTERDVRAALMRGDEYKQKRGRR